jgi:CheY-like chemotaxis protein
LFDNRRTLPRILLIEDNPGDVRLMREALATNGHPTLSVVEDGEEALSFLNRRGTFSNAPRPDLIFLDLNLPRKDGRQVLAEIKENSDLRLIPVIVLTTSESDTDVNAAYQLHANCYVKKPTDLDEYLSVVKACESFWLHIVRLPT